MEQSLRDIFDRSCRLCAEVQEVTIMIFSVEAEAMHLQNKLNKYLLIDVDEKDKLPKNICIRCCTKLQTVCEFIDTAHKAQQILTTRSLMLDQIANTDCDDQIVVKQEKTDPDTYFNNESPITEMEVNVDPMMYLQNSTPNSPVPEESPQHTFNDVTHLHGIDGENVTIKLIRRGDEDVEGKVKPFGCVMCNRSFLSELALKNHSWIHYNESKPSKEEDFQCYTCLEHFDVKNDLLAHLKEHRNNSKCGVCGRVFRTEQNLEQHMASHSSTSSAYICKICGRAYNTSSNLRTHSIAHSNERPYQCHICKKSFKRNQDLKFHINQHTGAKPYKCPFCDKSFASSGNCYSHRSRMHPGRRVEKGKGSRKRSILPLSRENLPVRPITTKLPMTSIKGVYRYQCQLCEHSFMKRDNFAYHMFQHTGEKPFQCSYCSDKFVTRRGLLIHHDNKHPTLDRPLGLISKNVLLGGAPTSSLI